MNQNSIYAMVSKDREEKLVNAINIGIHTKSFSLSHLQLTEFPIKSLMALTLRKDNICDRVIRLDLNNNQIREIPSLSFLPSLRELWLAYNPIEILPDVSSLNKLELIDIRNTLIRRIPSYLSTLTNIYEIDWQNTPFEKYIYQAYPMKKQRNLDYLLFILQQEYNRSNLEKELVDFIESFYLRKGRNIPNIQSIISDIIIRLQGIVPNFDDFKLFVRRASSFLPDYIEEITDIFLEKVMNDLHRFQRDTTKQRLSADLEISLRNFYFDRIERENVELIIKAIYDKVELLEDIEFLIKYSSLIFPPTSDQALDGNLVWNNILQLQSELSRKRQTSISLLSSALTELYPEIPREELNAKAEEISLLFRQERFATKKELNTLARVAADMEKLFPPDYASIDLKMIVMKVHEQKKK